MNSQVSANLSTLTEVSPDDLPELAPVPMSPAPGGELEKNGLTNDQVSDNLPPLTEVTLAASSKPTPRKRLAAIRYPVRKNIGLNPTDTLAEAGRKVLGFHFAQMLHYEPGTRAGKDIEALHDMRVATRRMRTALRVFGPAFSKKTVKVLGKGLRTTGRALGRVRDLDVFIENLQAYQQSLVEADRTGLEPLLLAWQAEHQKARRDLLSYLKSNKYRTFKQNFFQFVKTKGLGAKPVPAGQPIPSQVRHIAPVLIYTRYEAVRVYEVILNTASLEQLHTLRTTFKELRYVLEFLKEILGPECAMVIHEVKAVQDHLGALNDAHVASNLLNDFLMNWEASQVSLSLGERQNPAQLAVYLNAQLDQRHHAAVTFPQTWSHFNRPELRLNLALAVAAL